MTPAVVDFWVDPSTYNHLPVPDLLERIVDPAIRALKRATGPADMDSSGVMFRITAYRHRPVLFPPDEEVRDSEELDDGA